MLKKIISSSPEEDYAPVEEAGADYEETYEAPPAPSAVPMSYPSTPAYPETSYSSSPSQMSKNILSSDVQIKGSVVFGDELILDGRVEGEITSDSGHLTVGENASITGEVNTRAVVVFGKVDGNLTVTERCELKADAEIVGDIRAGTLSIEEGAAFMGQSSVGSAAVAKAQKAAGSGSGGGNAASKGSGNASKSGSGNAPRSGSGNAKSGSGGAAAKAS